MYVNTLKTSEKKIHILKYVQKMNWKDRRIRCIVILNSTFKAELYWKLPYEWRSHKA
jgi:hypothetical protein